MAFTAESVSILNGQDVVDVNSAESIENIKAGDFLQIGSFPLVEIKQAYKNGQGQKFIQLTKAWELTTQNNQPAIVIPTSGEFRAAVKALQDANILINDNQQALQDYQNNLGTVTFKKSDGTTTTVKTLKQIEADNQAQMNAYHPYPWAMRKVEFEAMRAENNEKYASSGFVHKGKEYAADLGNVINQGMYVNPASAVQERAKVLHLGRNEVSQTGESKTDYPFINIAGVVTKLLGADKGYSIGAWDRDSFIVKLPPAEDGTRTYDSATGVSVTHATSALAFAAETATNKVVAARVDMWGFEAYLREITDNDPFVYKNGLIQSLATDINGVTTVSDNFRSVTYFAWYEGDTTSRGKGVNWQTATEAQRIAIASAPENNIYFDDSTGKFHQWCVRGRSFAGKGNGDWANIDCIDTQVGIAFNPLNSNTTRPKAQGITDSDTAYNTLDTYAEVYVTPQSEQAGNNRTEDYGAYVLRSHISNNNKAVDNECYFLVCDTIERLNKGAYHPSFNPLGSAKTGVAGSGYLPWNHTSNDKLISRASCFKPWDGSTWGYAGGDIASGNPSTITSLGTGRPDGRYYDAIYASGLGGVCRDMRYSAWGLTAEDFAEQDLKIKSGEYRGREVLLKTKFIPETVTVGAAATYTAINAGGTIAFATSDSDNPRDQDSNEFSDWGATHWLLAGDNGETMVIKRVSLSGTSVKWPYSNNAAYLYGSGDVDGEFNSKFPVGTKLWLGAMYPVGVSVASEYTHTEVAAAPADILLCDDLKDGWVGSWNGFIPDGVPTEILWNKPFTNGLSLLTTDDSGASWQSGTPSFWFSDTAKNTSATVSPPAGRVILASYTTKARVTKSSVRDKILWGCKGVGMVYASSYYLDSRGRGFGFSLTGKLNTNTLYVVESGHQHSSFLALSETPILDNKLNSGLVPTHMDLTLGTPSNNSPAFKALNYNVAKNQQGFINYAYAQLTYDETAGDWGDDGKIHIADNQTTMPDENGHINLVGMAQCVEPIGWLKNDK